MFGGRWYELCTVNPDDQGRKLQVIEGPHLAADPSALQVTLEATGPASAPTGPPVIAWPSP
jgi:hypothetical protein